MLKVFNHTLQLMTRHTTFIGVTLHNRYIATGTHRLSKDSYYGIVPCRQPSLTCIVGVERKLTTTIGAWCPVLVDLNPFPMDLLAFCRTFIHPDENLADSFNLFAEHLWFPHTECSTYTQRLRSWLCKWKEHIYELIMCTIDLNRIFPQSLKWKGTFFLFKQLSFLQFTKQTVC